MKPDQPCKIHDDPNNIFADYSCKDIYRARLTCGGARLSKTVGYNECPQLLCLSFIEIWASRVIVVDLPEVLGLHADDVSFQAEVDGHAMLEEE